MPAGTGVCVVKTLAAITCWRAWSKVRLGLASSSRRVRSRARNALCPSFMWKTVGVTFSAARARTPPMPSTISCLMRSSVPVP
jgi:hypothetical protein